MSHNIPIVDLCEGSEYAYRHIVWILLLISRGFLLEEVLVHPERADIALLKLQVFKISAENGSL